MRFQLPITPRYVWPILLALAAFDVAVAAGTTLAIYRTYERASVFRAANMNCASYAPSFGDTTYLFARCTEVSSPLPDQHSISGEKR